MESQAKGAVIDQDADELAHHGFEVFHEIGEQAPHLLQGVLPLHLAGGLHRGT
ncbi:hypothetical protein [Paenarthrobacter sp. CAP02]|uniref:hypothetical protein n=1 Tax=Paenarthrobacter sp. CAP02 TaxID=3158144 RepID=UPI0032DAE924